MLHLETAPEIIIAIVAINAGLLELVKASITGAIPSGNSSFCSVRDISITAL